MLKKEAKQVDRKILLGGAFGTAIIIILASFSSVVGVHVNKSARENVSPLFHIRANRAINKEFKSCYTFVGKGKDSVIPLPKLGGNNDLMNKAIEIVEKLKNDPIFLKKIKVLFEKVRNNPQFLRELQNLKEKNLGKNPLQTGPTGVWQPTCLPCLTTIPPAHPLLCALLFLLLPILVPVIIIASLILPTCIPLCILNPIY